MSKKSTKKKITTVTKKKSTTKKKTVNDGIVKSKTTTKDYKVGSVLSIYYEIWIGGNLLSIDRKECIEKITIKETVDGSDSCTLQISDPKMVFINDDIYQENKRVRVVMRWQGYSHKVTFEGYISAVDIDFGSDGIPTLVITCMDNTYRMNKEKKTKTYKNKTSAQVVESIVKKYGYKCVIQSGYNFTKQETISQSDQTDIELIVSLANSEIYPFTACLVGNTFYYVKRGKLASTPIHEMTYREFPNDIISFKPQINTEVVEVTSGSTNTSNKKSNVSNAKIDGSKTNNTGNTTPSAKKNTTTPSANNGTTSNKKKLDPKTGKWS